MLNHNFKYAYVVVIMTELAELRKDVKLTVRALLKSFPTPMTIDMLEKDYISQVGRKIPFMKLGHTSLLEYLRSIPDAVDVKFCSDNITLEASNTVYVEQVPRDCKIPPVGTVHNRQNVDVFVSHNIQHPFYKFIMNCKTGVTVSEVVKFWQGGQTLIENGIQSTVREFLQTSITHLAFLREDRVYPLDLKNVQNNDSEVTEDLPALRLAAHIDDRTKKFIRNVLAQHPGGIHYVRFHEVYKQETGVHFECRFWGYHSILEMALHMPELFLCIQTGPSDWKLMDARQPVAHYLNQQSLSFKNTEVKSCQFDVLQNGLGDESKRCSCEQIVALVRRLYGNADFLKSLKSSALSCDAPCNKFHKIPQLSIPQYISSGASIQIHVSEVVSPDRFYFVVKDCDGKEVLDYLLTVMYEFYSTFHRQFQVKRDDIVRGLFCVVLYNGRCLRSQVHDIVNNENVLVQFVDYGVVASVDVDNLYYFHPAFGFFPQQALVGRLAHLRPVDSQQGWSRDAILFLYATLVNSLVTAIVTSVSREQQITIMKLVAETDDQEYIHVEQKMIALGYALHDNTC